MKLKRAILIFQVVFLLAIFSAVTFYFQYTNVKRTEQIASDSQKSDKPDNLPLAEEENGSQPSEEEEEQDDDRTFHSHEIVLQSLGNSVISPSGATILEFKEIHFEIVTPPPQA